MSCRATVYKAAIASDDNLKMKEFWRNVGLAALGIGFMSLGGYHLYEWHETGQIALHRAGPGGLNRVSASIGGASAGVRLPCGVAAG